MNNRPLESLKSVAADVARLVATGSENKNEMKGLMQQLGYNQDATKPPRPFYTPADNPEGRVGIWKPEWVDGEQYYVRDTALRLEWYFWAKTHKIPPKSDKPRIIYLGESVARGYLYDPNFTPADLLEKVVNATGHLNAEVLDLARVNLGLDDLMEVIGTSLALKPDAYVIYAGNNWIFAFRNSLTEAEFKEIEEAFLSEGFDATKAVLEQKFEQRVMEFLEYISRVSKEHNVPVVFLIPEFNLLDWKSGPMEQIMPGLSAEKTEAWLRAKDLAEQALAAGDVASLEAQAQLMIDIDPSNPLGFERMGECMLKKGQWEEARHFLELGRDTGIFSRIASKARTYQVVRRTLLREGERYGLHLVDLPEVYKEHLSGQLPGKNMFLDYCHISLEGIHVSMAPAAQRLLSVLANQEMDWKTLIRSDIRPNNDVIALAHLCAAVHNAHYGQPYDIIYHHCLEAVRASSVVNDVMRYYVDFVTRRCATKFCQSHEELLKTGVLTQYEGGLGFLHGRDRKIMDLDLVEGMINALATVGIDVREQVEQLRIDEHEVPDGGSVNLLNSLYQANSYDQFIKQETLFLQGRAIQSPFHLVVRKGSSLQLKLTYRTPERQYADSKVSATINGIPVAEFPVSADWTTQVFVLPDDLLVDGVNKLVINWPTFRNYQKPTKIGSFIDAMFPVLGEIHTFTASKNLTSEPVVQAAVSEKVAQAG